MSITLGQTGNPTTREIWWVALGICLIVLVANGAYRGWL